MKKVFQTIVCKDHGNCMQAAIASLLNLELEEVPNFIEMKSPCYEELKFLLGKDYEPVYIDKGKYDIDFMIKVAKFDGGVDGYFYGVVNSKTFENTTHAVIIDQNLNIVHDPNPNQKALELTPDDVIGFYVMHEMIIGKTGKLFTYEEWDSTTEEERSENTHKVEL